MKKLLMLPVILAACSKEKPLDNIPETGSVTYLHHYVDNKGFRYKTDTAIHWCRVSGEELKRFKLSPKYEKYCDENDTLELRIEKSCKPEQ